MKTFLTSIDSGDEAIHRLTVVSGQNSTIEDSVLSARLQQSQAIATRRTAIERQETLVENLASSRRDLSRLLQERPELTEASIPEGMRILEECERALMEAAG